MQTIVLHGNKQCFVDDDVFEQVNSFPWHTLKCGNGLCYAQGRPFYGTDKHLMHRYIFWLKGLASASACGLDINHKNGNGLDNRLENLELISHAENIRKANWKHGKSQHKGIVWMEANQKWRAYCSKDRAFVHIGMFDTIEQAIEARQVYLKTHNTNSL